MNAHSQRLQDLLDGDPKHLEDYEYHQDWVEGISHPYTRAGVVLPLILFCIPLIYHILFRLDYDLLPLPELLWHVLVYVTPARLLDAVDTYMNPLRISNPELRHLPKTHAAKSETMRRLLGMDMPGGIIESVAQAGRRRLSTLPGLSLNNVGDGRPAGLGNWDNSCYQNSVLQGLASLDSLSRYLTTPDLDDPMDAAEKPDMKMAEALKELIATLNDPSNSGRRIWTPATLKNMSSWQQQDAQEYFSKVLDEIDKEVGKVASMLQTSRGLESEDFTSSRSSSSDSLPIAIIRNPLEGLIAQRVGCTRCGYSEGLSMIPFNCLTVPMTGFRECDVSNCLDEYTNLEQIEGVECGKCTLLKFRQTLTNLLSKQESTPGAAENQMVQRSKIRLQAVETALEDDDYEDKTLKKLNIPSKNRVSSTKSRQAVVARPPKSLVVHFNRSMFDEHTGELRKNTAHVNFPHTLDLGSWCLGSSGMIDDATTEEWLLNPDKPMIASSARPSRLLGPMYELRAVVTHYGRHENGHYICYKKFPVPTSVDGDEEEEGKGQETQWWRLSDDDVSKVSKATVLGQGGVFMLFYDCIENGSTRMSQPEANHTPTSAGLAKKVDAPAAPSQPSYNNEEPVLPNLLLPTSIPLPSADDEQLLELEDDTSLRSMSHDESKATSVSEYDDDSSAEHEVENYKPVEPIVVSPYINKAGNGSGNGNQEKMIGAGGSLVMV